MEIAMRHLALAAMLVSATVPAVAAELDLMFGFRAVLAAAIRDDGYNCPDVKHILHLGPDDFGTVLKVTCGPLDPGEGWRERPLRVTAYVEGDFSTRRWRDPQQERQKSD